MTTDDAETAAVAAERLGIRYGVVVDTHSETTQSYGISGLPTLFVIDKRGVVRAVTVGVGPDADAELDALVQSLLAERVP